MKEKRLDWRNTLRSNAEGQMGGNDDDADTRMRSLCSTFSSSYGEKVAHGRSLPRIGRLVRQQQNGAAERLRRKRSRLDEVQAGEG